MPEISKEMNDAFNKQIKLELDSSYIYLAMSYWFKERELEQLAHFFNMQASEEHAHALKFADHVLETGGKVTFDHVEKPKNDYESVDEILATALKHEEHVTKEIYKLYDMALEKKEYNLKPILEWFIEALSLKPRHSKYRVNISKGGKVTARRVRRLTKMAQKEIASPVIASTATRRLKRRAASG